MFRAFTCLRLAFLSVSILLLSVNANYSFAATSQEQLNLFADHLDIKYRVLNNQSGESCEVISPCYQVRITLMLPFDFDNRDWQIYFSQLDKLVAVDATNVNVKLINGDLKVITPKPEFSGFKASQREVITLELKGDHYTEYKPLPNYYAVAGNLEPRVISSTREIIDPYTLIGSLEHVEAFTDTSRQFRNTLNDKTQWATAETLHRNNQDLSIATEQLQQAIIPTPFEVKIVNDKPADISNGLSLSLNGFSSSEISPAIDRLRKLGVSISSEGLPLVISASGNQESESEAYTLRIAGSGINIEASSAAGAAYGIASLTSLFTPGKMLLPAMKVTDKPRFTYRGMHLDVARNFHSKSSIIKLLDQMAAYKLNVLHLHLSDDEGWRVEIEGLPELTEIGGFRCHDLEENNCLLPQLGSGPNRKADVNGFYSKADFIEILQAAKARHIEILPSFDMPGHARSAIKAMEARYRHYMAKGQKSQAEEYLLTDFNDKTQYRSIQNYNDNTINVCMPSAYRFVEKVVDELSTLYQQAGLTMDKYHLGGDESPGAWLESPVCSKLLSERKQLHPNNPNLGGYFIERISNMLASKGIEPAGWNDGLDHTNPDNMPKVQSHIWALLPDNATQLTHKHLNQGWDVVLSLPEVSYFDMPHEADPKERGYDWAARHINSRKVFSYMPENLPVHAEIWRNLQESTFSITDYPVKQKDKRITGIQGHLWSETIRDASQAESMIFPRLLALAERAWHRPDWEPEYVPSGMKYSAQTNYMSKNARTKRDQAFNFFANTVSQKELLKLDMLGVRYRVPTAGARIQDGKLHMNTLFPGLPLEYRINSGQWLRYNTPVKVSGDVVEVRARSADYQRPGRSLFINRSPKE